MTYDTINDAVTMAGAAGRRVLETGGAAKSMFPNFARFRQNAAKKGGGAMEAFMKNGVVFFLVALVICGCASERYAARYGDGVSYRGIGDIKTFRKFYIRNEFKVLMPVAFSSVGCAIKPLEVHKRAPELFSRVPEPGDIPVDVTVTPEVQKHSGEASMLLSIFLPLLPYWNEQEQSDALELVINGDAKAAPPAVCRFIDNYKCSIFGPLGWIPYLDRDDFQRNETSFGLVEAVSFETKRDVVVDAVVKCIAQQLKTSALDMLTIPDVDFEAEGEDQEAP